MPKKKRGLAALPAKRRKEIARKGNQRLRELGKVHQFTSEEAAKAGARGGRAKAHPEDKIFAGILDPLAEFAQFEEDHLGVIPDQAPLDGEEDNS